MAGPPFYRAPGAGGGCGGAEWRRADRRRAAAGFRRCGGMGSSCASGSFSAGRVRTRWSSAPGAASRRGEGGEGSDRPGTARRRRGRNGAGRSLPGLEDRADRRRAASGAGGYGARGSSCGSGWFPSGRVRTRWSSAPGAASRCGAGGGGFGSSGNGAEAARTRWRRRVRDAAAVVLAAPCRGWRIGATGGAGLRSVGAYSAMGSSSGWGWFRGWRMRTRCSPGPSAGAARAGEGRIVRQQRD